MIWLVCFFVSFRFLFLIFIIFIGFLWRSETIFYFCYALLQMKQLFDWFLWLFQDARFRAVFIPPHLPQPSKAAFWAGLYKIHKKWKASFKTWKIHAGSSMLADFHSVKNNGLLVFCLYGNQMYRYIVGKRQVDVICNLAKSDKRKR